jgi:large-conductance mechanosensitive channel
MADMFNTETFRENLKTFIIDNGIIGTMAGVSIGIVTKDLISSLVGDIIIPVIIILLLKLNMKSLTNILPINGKASLNITNFIKQLVSWLLVIVITFVFVKGAVERIFGIDNSKKSETKTKETKETFGTYNNY